MLSESKVRALFKRLRCSELLRSLLRYSLVFPARSLCLVTARTRQWAWGLQVLPTADRLGTLTTLAQATGLCRSEQSPGDPRLPWGREALPGAGVTLTQGPEEMGLWIS